jgi:ribosome-associated protein
VARPDELAKLAEFVVIPRPGEAPSEFPKPFRGRALKAFRWRFRRSQIRARLKAGLPVEPLSSAIRGRSDPQQSPLSLSASASKSPQMDSKKLAGLCRDFADNKKAENIVILDVRDLSSVTDYFVIASGTSEPHLRAIVEEITDGLREQHDVRPLRKDGSMQGAWVVLDFFDVIVHVMRADARERYDLEGLWGDAARVKAKSKVKKKSLKR